MERSWIAGATADTLAMGVPSGYRLVPFTQMIMPRSATELFSSSGRGTSSLHMPEYGGQNIVYVSCARRFTVFLRPREFHAPSESGLNILVGE